MMVLWRVLPRAWSRAALDGEGARFFGGRWNPVGTPMVYTSTALSLAALETLVNADPADLLPPNLVAVEIRVPDRLAAPAETVDADDLPRGWVRYPAPRPLSRIGKAWIDAGRSALLRVPSAVIPAEWNVLVNPAHADARRLKVMSRRPFSWDQRLPRSR